MKWACFKIAFDQKMTEDMDTFGSWCPCSESLAQCHQRVVPYWFVKSYLLSHYFPCPCTRNVWTLSMTGSWCLILSFLPPKTCHVLFVLVQELHERFAENGRLCSIQPRDHRLCLYLPQRPQTRHCSTQETRLVPIVWLRRKWFKGHLYSYTQTLHAIQGMSVSLSSCCRTSISCV
jgi:hypothetical protein